ncbi:CocE/NonD family hydrolase [Rhodococcus artemisiae]|uniref:CocE/NonD family hydrolase n=1 Tax=Rhodococcus artemisiae TaxID=714159 RepID=A0ABU7LD80_9NOCA|nr:CocE/NonD family hydrolase [Rhodococcus artemisiae]MEE2059264.1 CocE/NonD family hydrolase [Rhodococcus artemisiae]
MGSWKRLSIQDPAPLGHHCVRVYPLPSDIVVDRDVPIRTADGTTLRANVYRPEGVERCPVLVCVTPYGKDAGVDRYPVDFDALAASGSFVGEFELSDRTAFEAPDPGYWVPRGYAVVVADLRGCFASGGRPRLLLGRAASDAADVVEWAGEQPWSTGKVGMAGASYLATLQWYIAAQQPPHLAAIAPWEGVTDPFLDSLCHGGIPETRYSEFWYSAMHRGCRSASASVRRIAPWLMRRFPDRFRHVAGPPPFEDVTVPALVGASWSDQGPRTRGSITGYTRVGSPDKWLYTHGRKTWQTFYGGEALDMQRRFFDHFLKGDDNGFDEVPRVRLETRHDLRTYSERHEQQWPLPDTRYVSLYLDHGTGGLRSAIPGEAASDRMFPVAGDEMVFTTTFDEDTEVTGHAALRLWVEAKDAIDMDLFVALKKIDPSGRDVRFEGHGGFEEGVVAYGWIRVSHRALDPEASTAYRPVIDPAEYRPLVAGQIVPVDIEIMPHSTFFEAGSSLALVITGHDFETLPDVRHDRTINQGFHIVHAGGRFDSHLLLPVVPAEISADDATGVPAASASLHDLPIAWGALFGRQYVRL